MTPLTKVGQRLAGGDRSRELSRPAAASSVKARYFTHIYREVAECVMEPPYVAESAGGVR
jgi:hypothetical protein